jgi:excisionase family DNA binding protein
MNTTLNLTSEASHQQMALLTAKEAAEYLRISISTLNRMERRGVIASLRTPGGHRRYTHEMLNACLVHKDGEIE